MLRVFIQALEVDTSCVRVQSIVAGPWLQGFAGNAHRREDGQRHLSCLSRRLLGRKHPGEAALNTTLELRRIKFAEAEEPSRIGTDDGQKSLRLPALRFAHHDHEFLAVIGEIKGRVTMLDKAGKVVATFGTNTAADEVGTNKTEPDKWKPGIVTAPHGVAFNAHGDVFVSEYNLYGRMHRFNRE